MADSMLVASLRSTRMKNKGIDSTDMGGVVYGGKGENEYFAQVSQSVAGQLTGEWSTKRTVDGSLKDKLFLIAV
jgi:hypothetical protein